MRFKRRTPLRSVAICLLLLLIYAGFESSPSFGQMAQSQLKVGVAVDWIKEGPAVTPELVAGPFDIHRRYRSMEGPWVAAHFRVGDLVESGTGILPEDRVAFVERDAVPQSSADSKGAMTISGNMQKPIGLKDTTSEPRKLYWMKGFKLEVLDENGKVMPSAEFICHLNLDIDEKQRNELFRDGERTSYSRLLTITQGQTEIKFPEGYAFPVASDEVWRISFQAANRTTDEHRRLRHRATFYFVKDADLVYPVTAMYVRVPSVGVVVDRNYAEAAEKSRKAHPSCETMSRGVNAPNSAMGGVYTDSKGRVVSGHWVVPPGRHEYVGLIDEQDSSFSKKDRTLRYGWVHVHPCCEETFIRECHGASKQLLCSAKAETDTKGVGIELKRIGFLEKPDGIKLRKGTSLEIGSIYNNTTSSALDAMITLGLFLDDVDFRRPDWALPGYRAPYCGATNECKRPDTTAKTFPLFDPNRDGPLLKKAVQVKLGTNDGNLNLVLDPSAAPQAATQIYKLFTAGVYDRTPFVRYEPGFVLQLAVAQHKMKGEVLSPAQTAMLRRLPLEASAQTENKIRHKRYALSLAREDNDENSAETSFSILLMDAPHLDGKYTIFGYLDDDAETKATLERMEQTFSTTPPMILGCLKK